MRKPLISFYQKPLGLFEIKSTKNRKGENVDKYIRYAMSTHEAGHFVMCKLLGDEPSLVTLDMEEGLFKTRHDIPRGERDANRRHLIIIAAAGFAAEQIVLGNYEEEASVSDAREITALEGTVSNAVALVAKLLTPLKYVVMSVAEAINAAADQGRRHISAEELQSHYELGLNVACYHAATNQRPDDSSIVTGRCFFLTTGKFSGLIGNSVVADSKSAPTGSIKCCSYKRDRRIKDAQLQKNKERIWLLYRNENYLKPAGAGEEPTTR